MSEDMSVAENSEATAEESGSLLAPEAQSQDTSAEPESMPHMESTEHQLTEGDSDIDWGDRPDWMPENFWDDKDGPDLEALAKSYQEMRSKMSAGKHKAPKDGKYDIASLQDHGVAEDDPLLNEFKGFAKENGLSQDQFDQITQMYMQHMGEMMDEVETNREAEIAKLGPKGEKVIEGLNQWLTKLGNSGALPPEQVDAIAKSANNADMIKALQNIRSIYGEKSIPDVAVQEGTGYSKDELMSMMNDPRYGKDMAFTNDVQAKWYKLHGEG